MEYAWLAGQEVDSWVHWVSLPLGRRLWLYRHGFTSPCGVLYDFERHGPGPYLSELQRYRLYDAANGGHRYLVDDKLAQSWMLNDHGDSRPTVYGVLDRGAVHGVAGTTYEGDPTPVADWLPSALRVHSRLVLKSLRGQGGEEVFVCAHEDGRYRLDGRVVGERELVSTVAELSGYVVTEYVDQHAYADRLYPDAANTIRALTVWDDRAGEVHVAAVVHRIGTDRSRPVDNFAAGGLAAAVDPETGELGRAVGFDDGGVRWVERHPDTGAPIAGVRVPDWERVLATVERLAADATTIPILGWDVLVDAGGRPTILEANTGTTVKLLQAHGPLLADDRVATVAARYLPGVDPS
jgi:hypothetical protein